MAGGYERVNARDDDDDYDTPIPNRPSNPNSPPPSFHSRSSSPRRRENVNQTLADAFESDGDDSDDDADDRQRLVRQNSTPSHDTSPAPTPVHQPTPAVHVPQPSRAVGGGASDGVFANMSARPERRESEKDEMPPTYEQAAADAVPPYWETTILAPGLGGPDEVYVDGLPVGSVFSFIWNCMISTSFQLVGFLLTYLLHSTHAAKNGSRAGLGITLIQYGFYMKTIPGTDVPSNMGGPDGYAAPPDPNSHEFQDKDVTEGGGGFGDITGSEWLAYVLMVVGWFILIRSTVEFLRARRHEMLVLQAPERGLGIPVVAENESSARIV